MATTLTLRADRQLPACKRRIGSRLGGFVVLSLAMLTIGTGPAFAASVVPSRAVQAASVPCNPTSTKLDGGPATTYCGPATAKLKIGGKTYSFKNGYCQSIKVSGIAVDVTLGTIAEGKSGLGVKGNAGKPYFSLEIFPGKQIDLVGDVDYGGKKLTSGGSVTATGTITASGSLKGTFKSAKGAYDLSNKPFNVSGSWNCHGVFAKH